MKLGIKAIVFALVFCACMPAISSESTQTSTSEQIITTHVNESKSRRNRFQRNRRVRNQRTQPSQSDQYSIAAIRGAGVVSSCARHNEQDSCAELERNRSILSSGCRQGNRNACAFLLKLQDLENAVRLSNQIRSF